MGQSHSTLNRSVDQRRTDVSIGFLCACSTVTMARRSHWVSVAVNRNLSTVKQNILTCVQKQTNHGIAVPSNPQCIATMKDDISQC